MKMVNGKHLGRAVWFSIAMLAAVGVAAEPTALQIVKEANRYVGNETRDKVLQVRSDRSTNGLNPDVWSVVYYDAAVRMKTTVITFTPGKAPRIVRPFSLFKRPDLKRIFDPAKVKIDSDAALKIAQADRLLDKVKLSSSRITLERWEDSPVWKIEFWAGKATEPGQTADIGQIFVNVEDGTVVNRDLHIDRAE
ncbi:MAG TPA: hypothetical protein VNT99_19070 [Methylomirabilota bacterium]|nr:hypothetical protein [Methylomirabilota bacterium]